MTLADYLRMDPGAATFVRPLGDSAELCVEIAESIVDELKPLFIVVRPPANSISEAVARTIIMARTIGFWSSDRPMQEAATTLDDIIKGGCGGELVESNALSFLVKHFTEGRLAARRCGFAGPPATVQ